MADYIRKDTARRIIDSPRNREQMLAILEDTPSEDVPHWIPCSKRLPQNERKTYWVCTEVGSQHECRWTNNRYGLCESNTWGWSIFDIPQFTEVVAWMPLPEPYKKDGEQNGSID